jgi:hypothetical protein
VVELTRFTLLTFEHDNDGVAALFELELARLVVATSYSELGGLQRDIEQRGNERPYRRLRRKVLSALIQAF